MARKLESLPEARVTERVSIDDLLDVARRSCCRSRGNRMKERENRELCLSIDIFIFLCIVVTGFLRVRQNLDPA